MTYTSDEINRVAYAISEDDVVSKMVLERNDHTLLEVPITGGVPKINPVVVVKSDAHLTKNSAAWTDVDISGSATARTYDIVIPDVKAGQWVEYKTSMFFLAGDEQVFLDVATIVEGAVVNTPGTATAGITGWVIPMAVPQGLNASVLIQLVEGDIEDGSVRLRLRFKSGVADRVIAAAGGYEWRQEGSGPFG